MRASDMAASLSGKQSGIWCSGDSGRAAFVDLCLRKSDNCTDLQITLRGGMKKWTAAEECFEASLDLVFDITFALDEASAAECAALLASLLLCELQRTPANRKKVQPTGSWFFIGSEGKRQRSCCQRAATTAPACAAWASGAASQMFSPE